MRVVSVPLWMKYLALTAFTLPSTVIFVVASALWVRSHTMTDDVFWIGERHRTRFRTSGGGFWFETQPWRLPREPPTEWKRMPGIALYPFRAEPTSPLYERLGFLGHANDSELLVGAPYWSVVAPSAALPLLWVGATARRIRRSRRRNRALCEQCGYDLRASPLRCPECGTAP